MKIVIFGNSGSGKSTLAKKLTKKHLLSHLDLDVLAWENTQTPTRKALADSQVLIDEFTNKHSNWVIEGCYADLLELIIDQSSQVYFINPGVDTCIENCKKRPWESHKYSSMEEQNKNLELLIDWIKDYTNRDDEFSLKAHQKLYNNFKGNKVEYNSNTR
jgi:adenylate kinase family enzyme